MSYVDLAFLPAQTAVYDCLVIAAADLSSPPAVVARRYGTEVVFDMAQNADLCCSGFAWVRLGTATPITTPGAGPTPCGTLGWRLELQVGIVGCAPMGDDQNIVRETQHAAAMATMAEFYMMLRRVICCFPAAGYEFSTGPIEPAGPQGGCMGATVTLLVDVYPLDQFIPADPPPDPETIFPLAPWVIGLDVGVPTGTVLTPTVGLPAPDAVEELLITHPVTGQQRLLTNVKVWRRRSWAATIQPHPALGETYYFDECRFAVPTDNFCVDVIDTGSLPADPADYDIMQPLAYFRRCDLDGTNYGYPGVPGGTGRCLNAAATWVWECDLRGAEDGFGTALAVVYRSNIKAATDNAGDPHPDGIQVAGVGLVWAKASWIDSGDLVIGSSGFRAGTDFSAIDTIVLHDCALANGGYNLQVRGDPGGRGVTNVDVRRCTFGPWGFGPHDFQDVTGVTWISNVDRDGNPVAGP